MRTGINTDFKPACLRVKLNSRGPQNLRLRVAHAHMPNAFFTNRSVPINGERTIYVHMPTTPGMIVLQVFNEKNGEMPNDTTFQVGEYKLLELATFPELYDSGSKLIREGVKFFTQFSNNASILSAGMSPGSVYRSENRNFRIDYLDAITDRRIEIPKSFLTKNPADQNIPIPNPGYGKEESTPARISRDRGIVEWSKPKCVPMAIPFRCCINFHEMSHFYINYDPRNEFEADKNGMNLAVGLGYGFLDICDGFMGVFENSPSDQNVDRTEQVKQYMLEMEKKYNRYGE